MTSHEIVVHEKRNMAGLCLCTPTVESVSDGECVVTHADACRSQWPLSIQRAEARTSGQRILRPGRLITCIPELDTPGLAARYGRSVADARG
jgi:hypothetical protein